MIIKESAVNASRLWTLSGMRRMPAYMVANISMNPAIPNQINKGKPKRDIINSLTTKSDAGRWTRDQQHGLTAKIFCVIFCVLIVFLLKAAFPVIKYSCIQYPAS